MAFAPETRTSAMAPSPGGVEIAAIVSETVMILDQNCRATAPVAKFGSFSSLNSEDETRPIKFPTAAAFRFLILALPSAPAHALLPCCHVNKIDALSLSVVTAI